MKTHRIALIAGDGIGPEVIAEGIKALDAAAKADGSRPESVRKTWTTAWPQPGESAESSGLLGPVTVEQ